MCVLQCTLHWAHGWHMHWIFSMTWIRVTSITVICLPIMPMIFVSASSIQVAVYQLHILIISLCGWFEPPKPLVSTPVSNRYIGLSNQLTNRAFTQRPLFLMLTLLFGGRFFPSFCTLSIKDDQKQYFTCRLSQSIPGNDILSCACITYKATFDMHSWTEMAPNNNIPSVTKCLSQKLMSYVCFIMYSALCAWLAYGLDL